MTYLGSDPARRRTDYHPEWLMGEKFAGTPYGALYAGADH
jgi:hypothetical protein